jgi:hypothetical protein
MFWLLKSRDSEPRNPKVWAFFFAFQKFVYVDVWALELTKSRTPKPRNAGLTFPFSHFGSLYMLMFGYLNSRSPEPRNPKMRVPPFLFRISEVCMLMFGYLNSRSPTPKSRNAGPTFPFRISKFVIMLMFGHLNSQSSELRNPRTPFLFSISRKSTRNPETHTFPLFRISEVCCLLMFGFLYSRNPELRNPEMLVTFHDFGNCCVLMLVVVFVKSRTPKSRNAGHFSRFRELLCVDVGCCTREIPNSEIPTCWSLFAISGVVVC